MAWESSFTHRPKRISDLTKPVNEPTADHNTPCSSQLVKCAKLLTSTVWASLASVDSKIRSKIRSSQNEAINQHETCCVKGMIC